MHGNVEASEAAECAASRARTRGMRDELPQPLVEPAHQRLAGREHDAAGGRARLRDGVLRVQVWPRHRLHLGTGAQLVITLHPTLYQTPECWCTASTGTAMPPLAPAARGTAARNNLFGRAMQGSSYRQQSKSLLCMRAGGWDDQRLVAYVQVRSILLPRMATQHRACLHNTYICRTEPLSRSRRECEC